jgi:hypothetical protein
MSTAPKRPQPAKVTPESALQQEAHTPAGCRACKTSTHASRSCRSSRLACPLLVVTVRPANQTVAATQVCAVHQCTTPHCAVAWRLRQRRPKVNLCRPVAEAASILHSDVLLTWVSSLSMLAAASTAAALTVCHWHHQHRRCSCGRKTQGAGRQEAVLAQLGLRSSAHHLPSD